MSIFVLFRVEIKEGREEEYRKLSAEILKHAKEQKGLISMERAKSILKKRTYVSIHEWESEEAIEKLGESSPTSRGHENREGGTLFLVFCEKDGRVAPKRGNVFLGKELGETGFRG